MRIYLRKKYLARSRSFWPLSLQPADLYCILLVVLCRMKNSCSRSLHIIVFLSQIRSTVKKWLLLTLRH